MKLEFHPAVQQDSVLEFFGDLERLFLFVSFVEIRRCLPFSSRKQAVQYCDSGCLQTLATQ
jgi:hypothetical protein